MPNNPDGIGFVPHPHADRLREAADHLRRAASALVLCAAGDGDYDNRSSDADVEIDAAEAILKEVIGARL